MTFFFAFTDGVGEFELSQEIFNPNGKKLSVPTRKRVVKGEGGWLVFAAKFSPFAAIPGIHKVTFLLDDRRYDRALLIERVETKRTENLANLGEAKPPPLVRPAISDE